MPIADTSASKTHKHQTRILCDTCHRISMHDTQTAAMDAIDQHILDTGHCINFYLSPNGWILFGGI